MKTALLQLLVHDEKNLACEVKNGTLRRFEGLGLKG
jgi:hypothetical protein